MALNRARIDDLEARYARGDRNAEIARETGLNVKTIREYRFKWQVGQRTDGVAVHSMSSRAPNVEEEMLRWQQKAALKDWSEAARVREEQPYVALADEVDHFLPLIEAAPFATATKAYDQFMLRFEILGFNVEDWKKITSATLAADALQRVADGWKVPLSVVQAAVLDPEAWNAFTRYRADVKQAEKTQAVIKSVIDTFRMKGARARQQCRKWQAKMSKLETSVRAAEARLGQPQRQASTLAEETGQPAGE